MEEWSIDSNGKVYGPLTLAQVYDWLDGHEVGPNLRFCANDQRINLDMLRRGWPDPRADGDTAQQRHTAESSAVAIDGSNAEKESMRSNGKSVDAQSAAGVQTASALGSVEAAIPVIDRDAILLLGRRRAGKTVYLATLYSKLWKNVNGLTMRALSGTTHQILMTVNDQLRRGEWPAATLSTQQLEFELQEGGRKRLLVAFDYSGETFKKAFVDELVEDPEVKALMRYVDRAAAVILLIDPSAITSGVVAAEVDDDFGMVQAVQRIRNWAGGEEVPVVLALTKADRNRELIRSHGSAREFVLRNFPALARTLRRVAIFPVLAVQERRDGKGHTIPSEASIPINVEQPLTYCLKQLGLREQKERRRAAEAQADAEQAELIRQAEKAEAVARRRVILWVVGLLTLIACGLECLYLALKH